jgi:hypothetical protein
MTRGDDCGTDQVDEEFFLAQRSGGPDERRKNENWRQQSGRQVGRSRGESVGEEDTQEASLFLQHDAGRHVTHAPVLAHGAVTVTATTRETSAREEGRHANNNERGEPRSLRRDVSIGEADD